jgi:hypothetical protein
MPPCGVYYIKEYTSVEYLSTQSDSRYLLA